MVELVKWIGGTTIVVGIGLWGVSRPDILLFCAGIFIVLMAGWWFEEVLEIVAGRREGG